MSNRIVLKGIHHIKMPVSNVEKSLEYYLKALQGSSRDTYHDHYRVDGSMLGAVLNVPGIGDGAFELREDPEWAKGDFGMDPITYGVETKADLLKLIEYFDSVGVENSGLLVGGVGYLVVTEDPDRRRLRFYCWEDHLPEEKPSDDSPWIRPLGDKEWVQPVLHMN